MARRRSLSKSISISEQVDILSDRAALFFTWMIPHADDFGRLPGSARKLAALVIPLKLNKPGWTVKEIESYLIEMSDAKDEGNSPLIYRYISENVQVIQLLTFDSHQDGLHKRTKSKYPDPPSKNIIPEDSGKFPEIPSEEKRREEEEKRREEEADLTPNEKESLNTLKNTPNYPYDRDRDLFMVRDYEIEFSSLNIPEQLKKWRAYKQDHPLNKKSNPRSQIRNWLTKAVEFQKKDRKPPQAYPYQNTDLKQDQIYQEWMKDRGVDSG